MPKVQEGVYPHMNHKPTAKHHHVPTAVRGQSAARQPSDPIPTGDVKMSTARKAREATNKQYPWYTKRAEPPKGKRS